MEVLNFITVILLTIIGAIEKYSALIKYNQHSDLLRSRQFIFPLFRKTLMKLKYVEQ